jgi:tripartite-type tricarboxylate transporter receptor subunit TctC
MLKRTFLALAAATLFAAPFTTSALAQDYPDKPITLVVPFGAGGPTDVIARVVGEHMSKTLGQTIVVENVAGAGGTTGSARVAAASPDGYTLVMGNMGTHAASVHLYPDLKYKPDADFTPIGLAGITPIVIIVKKDFPAKDVKEFIDYLKANGDKVNSGHAGAGSVSDVTCELLKAQLALPKINEVAFKGTGPALNDLVAGQIDFMCDQITNSVPQVKAGEIRALAIATPARSPALPDVPTTTEAGIPDYQISGWNALFAPKGTPADVQAKLVDALVKALDDPETAKKLTDLGTVIPTREERTPDALKAIMMRDTKLLEAPLKSAGAVAK